MNLFGCESVNNCVHFDEVELIKQANKNQVHFVLFSNNPFLHYCMWLSARSSPLPNLLSSILSIYNLPFFQSVNQASHISIYHQGLQWLILESDSRKQDRALRMTNFTGVPDMFTGSNVQTPTQLMFSPRLGWRLSMVSLLFCHSLPAQVLNLFSSDSTYKWLGTQMEIAFLNCWFQEKKAMLFHGVSWLL